MSNAISNVGRQSPADVIGNAVHVKRIVTGENVSAKAARAAPPASFAVSPKLRRHPQGARSGSGRRLPGMNAREGLVRWRTSLCRSGLTHIGNSRHLRNRKAATDDRSISSPEVQEPSGV